MNAPRKSAASTRSHSKDKEPASISFDYDHLLRLCRKHWMWLAGATLLGIIGGVVDASLQVPIYSAQATIFVPATDASVVNTNGNAPQPDFGGDMIKTFEQLLQTRDLVEGVVSDQKLNENPEFLPDGLTPPVSIDTAAGILAGEVDIHIRNPTRLIDISVEHPSPKMAAFLANAVAQEAVNQQMKKSNQSGSVLSDYLQKEIDRLRGQLETSEGALEAYKVSHNITSGTDTPDTAADSRLKELNQELETAQAQVTLLSERYLPQHPKLIQAQETVDELQKQVQQMQSSASNTPPSDSGYTALKSEVDSYAAQLASMEKEKGNAEITTNVSIPGLRVVSLATPPNVPVRPSKRKIVTTGAFLGLLCGVGFIMALYFLDNSVRTVSQAESTFGLPVIAAVPIVSDSSGKSQLPTLTDPQSFVAESFRGLRAALILQDREKPSKTILVVSAVPGEGKSFCAANLAVAFAQAGLKTLLIDADMRLPTVHEYFKLPTESSGFTDILTGRGTLETAAVQTSVPALRLLLTTIAAESPAELLSTHRMSLLLEEAAPLYDRIVIDSAPLNAVSDTMLIMPKADAILLVVRASQTPASETRAAIEKISSSKMKPLGLILNYLAPHTLKAYSYGYSYGQKPKDKNAR